MDLKDINELAGNMTEPTTTATGAALILNKIITIMLPIGASLLAFWLGLRFVPVRQDHIREDMVNRVMGCLFSSVVLGITTLVLLYHHFPGLFVSANKLAAAAFLPPAAGFFTLTACVLIVCAIPGPWIVAGIFLWLEKRKGKDIGEMFNDLRHDVKGRSHNDWKADYKQDEEWNPRAPYPENNIERFNPDENNSY